MTAISGRLRFVVLGAGALLLGAAAGGEPTPQGPARTVAASGSGDETVECGADHEGLTQTVLVYRTRATFESDKEYGEYVKKTVRVGWRVRAAVDYERVKKGMTGTYYGTNSGSP